MGNHEYCADCEENSYHYGLPCNPEKKASVDRKREKERIEHTKAVRNRQKFIDKLNSEGIQTNVRYITTFDQIPLDELVIPLGQFYEKEEPQ
jgi:hypothetical protein